MLKLRHPISLLAISLLVLAGVVRWNSPPAPLDADAPELVFSATRAVLILRDLLREGRPHVSGSKLNAVVRDRVISNLERSGYDPQLQSLFHCNALFGACSQVDNILAVKPGSNRKNAVLLTAHYDSSWTGPGAADDGAGTAAVLEIARMAANFPAFENDVIFLLSDSEENGLIGADAFAREHPLFARVKVVINLEARGVTGPSAMFETGYGNRSIIRMLAKNVDRPVANSLTYEVYRRMPNDTDFSVYKREGVTGMNFAFSQGVSVYHSAIDDPDHLDLGSLQHQGDNAWAMLKAFGERDLNRVISTEDAGYIDIFGWRLVHYPVSIALGLTMVLGVCVLLAVGLAFRKDFHIWQMRWGLLAIPLLLILIPLGAWVISWPLGHWPDLHPLEHPYPWIGRLALFLMFGLSLYVFLRFFSERVSPCAMMMLGWSLIFALGMAISSKMPSIAHIVLIPMTGFVFGSLIDLFRKKSRAPLLMASLLGFTASVYISLYHFFMLDVALNFDRAQLQVIPLVLMALTVMPMLLAWAHGRELGWQPAMWLAVAILALCFIHLALPGFTPERPRGMELIYHETLGGDSGQIVLESMAQIHDHRYARGHGFSAFDLDRGGSRSSAQYSRQVPALRLPGVDISEQTLTQDGERWRHGFDLVLPEGVWYLNLSIPLDSGLRQAWLNDQLALDTALESKHDWTIHSLRLIQPGRGPYRVELVSDSPDPLPMKAVTWRELPAVLIAPFMGDWPADAQPVINPPRAQVLQYLETAAFASKAASPVL